MLDLRWDSVFPRQMVEERKTSYKHNNVGRIHLRGTGDKGLISDDEKLI